MKSFWKAVSIVVAAWITARTPALAQNPEILPTYPNSYTYPVAINNPGEIIGVAYGREGGVVAVRWVDGAISKLDGFSNSIALGMNDSGTIVGAGYENVEDGLTPVVWVDGKAMELPSLGLGGIAYDINTAGDIVGWVNTPTYTAPAVWRGGKLTVLPTLRESGGEARSIDDDGTIAGFSTGYGTGDQIPTRWLADVPAPLPVTFGDNYIGVLGVNKTGTGRTAGYLVQKEFLAGVGEYLINLAVGWQGDEFRVLQRPGDQGSSIAYDVTAKGIYVGATTSEDGYLTPTLWDVDGASRLPIDFGREASAAAANETGLVVGVDRTDGRNPIPVLWRLDSFERIQMSNMIAAPGSVVSLQSTITKAGRPVRGKPVEFRANGQRVGFGMSDARGVAKIDYRVPISATRPVPIMASLGGSTYVFRTVGIGRIDSVAAVTPSSGFRKREVKLRGSLRSTAHNAPLAGRTVTFSLRGRVVATGVTDRTGRVSAIYSLPSNLPKGTWPLEIRFAGDRTTKATVGRASLAIIR